MGNNTRIFLNEYIDGAHLVFLPILLYNHMHYRKQKYYTASYPSTRRKRELGPLQHIDNNYIYTHLKLCEASETTLQ